MSFDGTWKVEMNTPMGKQNAELKLESSGDSLSGEMKSPMGSEPISEGKVDGSAATWAVSLTKPMPIKLEFDAAVEGDSITGNVKMGAFGKSSFTGTRA